MERIKARTKDWVRACLLYTSKGIVIIVAVAADAYGRYKNSGLKRSGILARIFNRKEGSVKPI